jgi:L-iditol 2-dehydrogenase/L-idonate 5-dehydrogenase
VLDPAGSLVPAELPAPDGDAVLVRVAATGICGTDLLAWRQRRGAPVVLGHEVAGVVEEDSGGTFAPGDRVLLDPAVTCGACAGCVAGQGCADLRVVGDTYGAGGLAELLRVPATALLPVPATLPMRAAALVEPAACAHRAVARSGARAGDRVVVLGAGGLGVALAQVLRATGVRDLLVVEPVAGRRAAAAGLGLDVAAAAPGDGRAAVTFEATGRPAAVGDAVAATARGGTVLVAAQHAGPLDVAAETLFGRELTLRWSLGAARGDFAAVLALLASGALPPPSYAHVVTLAEVDDALFARLDRGAVGKTVVDVAS